MSREKSARLFEPLALLATALALCSSSGAIAQVSQPWPPEVAPDMTVDLGPGWPPRVVDIRRPLPGKPFKEGFVEVDGFRVRYVEAGKGPVIVSFPGSGGLEMSTAKDMLSAEYRVIEINPPGWGPDPVLKGERDMRDMATVFVHALDQLKVDKFHLVATSMGCNHAMYAAIQFPQRVLSLTLEGGECFTRPQDRRAQTPRAVEAQKAATEGKGFNSDYSIWAGWPAYQWSENKWWQTPSYQARLMQRRYINNFPYTRNAHRNEMLAGVKNLTMPTLQMVGDRDEIMKVSVAQAWKEQMPLSKFAIVAGGTHDLQNSQPEQFVEIMKACSLDPSPSKLMCPGD